MNKETEIVTILYQWTLLHFWFYGKLGNTKKLRDI